MKADEHLIRILNLISQHENDDFYVVRYCISDNENLDTNEYRIIEHIRHLGYGCFGKRQESGTYPPLFFTTIYIFIGNFIKNINDRFGILSEFNVDRYENSSSDVTKFEKTKSCKYLGFKDCICFIIMSENFDSSFINSLIETIEKFSDNEREYLVDIENLTKFTECYYKITRL